MTSVDLNMRLANNIVHNKRGAEIVKGSKVYICVHTDERYLAAESQTTSHWFFGAQGFSVLNCQKRYFNDGSVYWIFPERTPQPYPWTKDADATPDEPHMCLPGGRSARDERLWDCACRKMKEETNLDIRALRDIPSIRVTAKEFESDDGSPPYYGVYIAYDPETLPKTVGPYTKEEFLTIADFDNRDGLINQHFESDLANFRPRIDKYHRDGNASRTSDPPRMKNDALSGCGMFSFHDAPAKEDIFFRQSQKNYLAVVNGVDLVSTSV